MISLNVPQTFINSAIKHVLLVWLEEIAFVEISAAARSWSCEDRKVDLGHPALLRDHSRERRGEAPWVGWS